MKAPLVTTILLSGVGASLASHISEQTSSGVGGAARADVFTSRLRGSFRSRVGIALLELMLAVAILGVALISLGISVGRCVRGLTASEQVRLALDAAEQVRAERQLAAIAEGEVKTGVFEGERPGARGPVSWKQQVETTDDPNLLRSTLTIRWSERGRIMERSFVELASRKALRVAGSPVAGEAR